MDTDPRSEGLCGQDPPRPPCVPVSPRPRDTRFQSVSVSCPVLPSGPPGGVSWLQVLLRRIQSLQRADQVMVRKLDKAQGHSEGLRQHLEQLEEREAELEVVWQQVQDSLRVTQLHGREVEAKGQRRQGLCLEQEQDLAGAEQQQEQLRDLCREHRWEFWQQLDTIIKEHKHLHHMHVPAHLEAEMVQLEKTRENLLKLERGLMAVEEQLGQEALVASRLVEQEQEEARQQLEVELGQRQVNLQLRDRLAEELQQLEQAREAPLE